MDLFIDTGVKRMAQYEWNNPDEYSYIIRQNM